MSEPKNGSDVATFLARAGLGRRIIQLTPKETFFSQGDPADACIFRKAGQKLRSSRNREGGHYYSLGEGDFVGKRRSRSALGDGYRHHRLHRAQDQNAMR